MNKQALVSRVAKQTGLTATLSAKIISAAFEVLKESFEKGERTTIHGFGSFSNVEHKERNGVNPSTMQPMRIIARKSVRFVSSKALKIK